MMRVLYCLVGSWVLLAQSVSTFASEDEKFDLRYRFQPNATMRWNVEQRTEVRTSISGTTQNAETLSLSVKAWRVKSVDADGNAVFEHLVESVDMRQKLADSAELRYNSQTDKKAPPGFEDAAASVGVVLATITINPQGKVLKRERRNAKNSAAGEGDITLPLPEQPVALGHAWSQPCDIDVPLDTGGMKKIKAVQQFKLESVKNGVAAIRVATQILTPITDPAIEAQLVQREGAGVVRFDIDAGRILSQQMNIDKHVVGFRGEASSIHYLTRFSEQFVPEPVKTADGRR